MATNFWYYNNNDHDSNNKKKNNNNNNNILLLNPYIKYVFGNNITNRKLSLTSTWPIGYRVQVNLTHTLRLTFKTNNLNL